MMSFANNAALEAKRRSLRRSWIMKAVLAAIAHLCLVGFLYSVIQADIWVKLVLYALAVLYAESVRLVAQAKDRYTRTASMPKSEVGNK
jgi:hypothetical protein